MSGAKGKAAVDPQVLLRQLQKARAVARCIQIAAEYPDDDIDFADAVAGLLLLIEPTLAMAEGSP